MEAWVKWLFLCFFATFPYSLIGFFILDTSISFTGGFLLFAIFVTAFYALDKRLIRYGTKDFSQYFQDVVLLKLACMLILAMLVYIVKIESFTIIMGIDVLTSAQIQDFLIINGREVLFQNTEYYPLFKELLFLMIFLMVEGFYLILGTIVLKWYKNKF